MYFKQSIFLNQSVNRLFLTFIVCVLGIECMQKDCHILVPEDFLCNALSKPELRDKYTQLSFTDHVKVCVVLIYFDELS